MIFIKNSFYFICAIALFGFAALQFNDPDPADWVLFYSVTALIPCLLLANRFYRPLFWMVMGMSLLQLSIAAPGTYEYFFHTTEEPLMQSMNPNKPYIEECREFLGAFIALALNLICVMLARIKPWH